MSLYCPLSMASGKPRVCIESDEKPLSDAARCYCCPFDSLSIIAIALGSMEKRKSIEANNRTTVESERTDGR